METAQIDHLVARRVVAAPRGSAFRQVRTEPYRGVTHE
jgi:hypothetical protein